MIGKWGHILLGIIVSCAIVSCGGHSDRASLVALDSLILQNPDSACELLATYPADSLTTADDRAYHALLTTIADYKAYRPATADSVINIAVNHYDHNDANPDHRMRSLLYKGCVMEELGNPEQAIEYYKRAETLCPADDYFNKGYIDMRKAELYQRFFNDSIPIYTYKNALYNFQKAGNLHFESIVLNSIGSSYIFCNIDSAEYYIKKCISLSKMANDSIATAEGLLSLCSLYYNQESYKQVTTYAYETIVIYGQFLENRLTNDIISISFAKNNMIDSAHWYFTHALPVINIADSISMLRAQAELAMAKGDLRTYIHYNNIAVDKSDSILIASQADKIKETEAKYDMAQQEIMALTKQRRLISVIVALAFIIIAVSFVVYIQRKRIALSKREMEVAQYQLSDLRNQIANSLQQIDALKQQQETTGQISEQLDSLINSVDTSLECYSNVLDKLLKQMKTSSNEKNAKLAAIMNNDFFAQLHKLVNMRHDNLVDRLHAPEFRLSDEEINIICLDLCKFPTSIIWIYSDCDKIHSVYNKKKIIARKVNNCDSIAQIPDAIN